LTGINMSDKLYICPKCLGTQHAKGKCKQCGTKVIEESEYFKEV